ncbi:MAG TPA: hypothetical protein ENK65_00255 [Helicobacteraceae bacterium]|nr:hypothetical protein [Helicobacteraceae bacterium]
MSLKEELMNFGVSEAFITIALTYSDDYTQGDDIEAFIELVEEKHAIVEEKEYQEALAKEAQNQNQTIDVNDIFGEEPDEEILEDY